MATSDDARADGANDFPNSSAVDADPEAHKQLPPVGSIKFQPSSEYFSINMQLFTCRVSSVLCKVPATSLRAPVRSIAMLCGSSM